MSRAQFEKLSFEAITTRQGLSNNSVTSIAQDRQGFMWFGTATGLNQYNGYSFTVFRSSPERAPNSLHNDVVWDLHEDRQGRFWVSTLGDGLYELNQQNQRLTPHRLSSSPNERYKNIFYSVYEESQTVLWVGTQMGLVRFDKTSGKMQLYELQTPNDHKVVFCITADSKGRLWVGTKVGLYSFDPRKGTYTAVPLTNGTPMAQPLVSALHLDARGVLWVGTNGEALFKLGTQGEGLFKVDTRSPAPTIARYNPQGKIRRNIALNGIINYRGDIWVATDEGLQRINGQTGEVVTYIADRFSVNTLSSSNILSLFEDRSGNLWIGTDNGVNKVINGTKQFYTYQVKPAMPTVRIVDNNVSTILQDRRGVIWLGNTATGLFRFDPATGQIMEHPAGETALLSKHVWSVFEDSRGWIWVGTLEGLHRFDGATGRVTRYPSLIPTQYITEDRQGHLWVGGKKGIAAFDPVKGQYSYLDTAVNAGFNYITDLMISRRGDLWIAQQGALQRYNPRTRTQSFFQSSVPLKKGEITDRDVSTLFEDSRGLIWVGTERGALNCFNPATQTFTAYTTAEGLPDNSISGIVEDRNGNLWISTNKGISRLTVKTKSFRNYDISDGLPEMEFNKSSVSRKNRTLLFGSINGFLLFNPDSIRDNNVQPPVYITGLKIQGKSRPLDGRSTLQLAYDENSLSFDFVALNYDSPRKNRYAYQLDGVDEEWVDSGFRRFANYTELSPGTYAFRVRASNNDGIWNNAGTTLTIVIAPPWWRTWWAYGLYALLAGAVIWGVIAYRSRNLQRKNRQLENKVKERTRQVEEQKEEIEAQRDNLEQTLVQLKATQNQLIQKEKMASLGELTAGVAHEIQNPLNFVNNFAELCTELVDELEEERQQNHSKSEMTLLASLRENLQKISHHGQRASAIVRGMLEHSRASTGDRQPTDLKALCEEYLRLAYHGLRAKDKTFNCRLVTQLEPSLGKVVVIPQELGRVLLNLFNNAFYAVQQQQAVSSATYEPTVSVSTQRFGNGVRIRVVDNGAGMDPSVQEKIFQPFFTTKPTGEGTGLGLSLSYDIVTKGHGGQLTVESAPGQGSAFTIWLPVE